MAKNFDNFCNQLLEKQAFLKKTKNLFRFFSIYDHGALHPDMLFLTKNK